MACSANLERVFSPLELSGVSNFALGEREIKKNCHLLQQIGIQKNFAHCITMLLLLLLGGLLHTAISINVVGLKSSLKTRLQCFVGLFFMNNFIKIIPARARHCTANYNLLFSPGMTDFDEFINKNPT